MKRRGASRQKTAHEDELGMTSPQVVHHSSGQNENNGDNAMVKPKTSPFLQEQFIDALYKPHTISFLLASLGVMLYFAFLQFSDTMPTETNVKRGITASVVFFIVYCGVQLKDGILLRPHPAFWRLVTGVGLVYLFALIFLLFQSRDDARSFFTYLYPDLGVPLPERDYADDCRLFTPDDPVSSMRNLRDTVLDEFIIAHTVGYIAKALLFRDMKLLWVLSLTFELAEITWQHWLPNFKECWWDHLIVDVAICNFLGMIIGLLICDYWNMKKYPRWIGVSKIPDTKGKVMRVIKQFTPYSWTNYDWDILRDYKRFLYFIGVVVLMNLIDLNAFFLKYILWIPPRNPLNVYRLILWFFLGVPAIREYYEYVSNPACKRVGDKAWLAAAIAITELFIIIKFSTGLFNTPYPNHIWAPWALFGIFITIWFVLQFFVFGQKKSIAARFLLNSLVILAIAPLVFMFFAACPDIEFMKTEFDDLVDSLLAKVAAA